jgi:hypothetical protein
MTSVDRTTPRSTPRKRLFGELRRLRRLGLADPRDRLHQFRGLLRIARSANSKQSDFDKVVDILERAAARLGRVYGPTVLTLYGLTDAARGLDVEARRKLAHEVFCAAERVLAPGAALRQIAFSTFRTHTEKAILNDLATELIAIDNGE